MYMAVSQSRRDVLSLAVASASTFGCFDLHVKIVSVTSIGYLIVIKLFSTQKYEGHLISHALRVDTSSDSTWTGILYGNVVHPSED